MSDIDIQVATHTNKDAIDKYQANTLNEIKGLNEDKYEEESITDEDFVDENMLDIKINKMEYDEESQEYEEMEVD